MKFFDGTAVNYSHRYPRVYRPEHPVSNSSGWAYVHRIVAFMKYGEKVLDQSLEVHHIDGDKLNWDKDNLVLLEKATHYMLHSSLGAEQVGCRGCGIVFEARKTKKRAYCSGECFKKSIEKTEWPSRDDLLSMVKETSFSEVGRYLGVSCNAVRKRIANH